MHLQGLSPCGGVIRPWQTQQIFGPIWFHLRQRLVHRSHEVLIRVDANPSRREWRQMLGLVFGVLEKLGSVVGGRSGVI